ncbi:MAG TPA: hypothetical protein VMV27_06695 [Candidatus Binataceae bacterium]|nr:hypothetical protein [Candidatus Binataceae bacterium]
MLRPTIKELLTGLQGTVTGILIPELTSPYAQGQAMHVAMMLARAAAAYDQEAKYLAAESKDLSAAIAALNRLAPKHLGRGLGDLKKAAARGAKAAKASPPDHRAMEAAISEFAAALALGRLDDATARIVRTHLKRHLDRAREFLGNVNLVG